MKQKDLDKLRKQAETKISVGSNPMPISPNKLLALLDMVEEHKNQYDLWVSWKERAKEK